VLGSSGGLIEVSAALGGDGSSVALLDYHERGDLRARSQVIEQNLPLVHALARRFARPAEPLDDLVQAGAIGLIKAVDGFRADRGRDLGAYAVPTIVGELRRHRRDGSWPVRLSPQLRHTGTRVSAAPLDDALPAISGESDLEQGEMRAALGPGFRVLSPRERRIVALRFYRDLSQARIAAEVGLSQAQVSRELRSALAKMRAAIGRPG
jgi:RNA polymerase sigma-B factor